MIRLILLLLLLAPAGVFGQESQKTEEGPSLVELARRERERRSRTKKVPIITNATLRNMQGGRIGTSEAAPAPGEEGEGQGEGQEEGEGQESAEASAAEWQAKFSEARMNLSNAVNQSMVLELQLNDLRNSYFREDDGATQGRLQQQMQETIQQLEGARQEAQRAREAIQQLQNEARAAGLTPGEVRDLTGELPEGASAFSSPYP